MEKKSMKEERKGQAVTQEDEERQQGRGRAGTRVKRGRGKEGGPGRGAGMYVTKDSTQALLVRGLGAEAGHDFITFLLL